MDLLSDLKTSYKSCRVPTLVRLFPPVLKLFSDRHTEMFICRTFYQFSRTNHTNRILYFCALMQPVNVATKIMCHSRTYYCNEKRNEDLPGAKEAMSILILSEISFIARIPPLSLSFSITEGPKCRARPTHLMASVL